MVAQTIQAGQDFQFVANPLSNSVQQKYGRGQNGPLSVRYALAVQQKGKANLVGYTSSQNEILEFLSTGKFEGKDFTPVD